MFSFHLTLFCVYAHFQLCEKAQKYINLTLTKQITESELGGWVNAKGRRDQKMD
jgi:hypothetical protein